MLKSSKSSHNTSANASVKNRTIKRAARNHNYIFARPSVVPEATYTSKIVGVEDSKTRAGDCSIDILYDLIDASNKKYHIRMRYPVDGFYYDKLCESLLDAGLPENSTLSKAVGIEEEVVLSYPNGERIGSFTSRSPANGKKNDREEDFSEDEDSSEDQEVEEYEEDFDDFLDDED